jgi:hypothetical protein
MNAYLSPPAIPTDWATLRQWARARRFNPNLPLEACSQARSLVTLLDTYYDASRHGSVNAPGLWQSCLLLANSIAALEKVG